MQQLLSELAVNYGLVKITYWNLEWLGDKFLRSECRNFDSSLHPHVWQKVLLGPFSVSTPALSTLYMYRCHYEILKMRIKQRLCTVFFSFCWKRFSEQCMTCCLRIQKWMKLARDCIWSAENNFLNYLSVFPYVSDTGMNLVAETISCTYRIFSSVKSSLCVICFYLMALQLDCLWESFLISPLSVWLLILS